MALPTEIWNQIIDKIQGRNELLNLCSVNRHLSAIVYPVLYRNIDLTRRSKVELALNTFEASPELLLYVHWLSLKLGRTDVEWILDHKYKQFTAAINSMKNLRRISLYALFMHKAPGSKYEMTWTRDWDISQIERLDIIGGAIPSRLPDLFAKVPDRLLCLTVRGDQDMAYVDGITELRCDALRGVTLKPLKMLKRLLVTSGIYVYSTIDFTPNLKVVALFGYDVTRDINQILESKIPRTIKSLGLIFCSQFSMDFVDKMSQFSQLEVAVIESPPTAYDDFSVGEVESLAQAMPRVHTIGVLCSKILHSGGSALFSIKIWGRQARKTSADSYDMGQWSNSTEKVRRGMIESLLGFD